MAGMIRIEAENFNQGGEGVGDHAIAPGSPGGPYRPADSIAIEPSSSDSNGYDVGPVAPGQWMEYTVSVATSGIDEIDLRKRGQPGARLRS